MNRREMALEHIRIEVAKNGEVTPYAVRMYVENSVSYSAFKEAVNKGMEQFRRRNE